MQGLLLVALGGALGAVARYGVGLAAAQAFGAAFPWGTLAVNVVGGLAMGVLVGVGGDERLRLLFGVGVLGGFTTFSAFSLETALMFERGAMVSASLYVIGSVTLSVAALMVGLMIGRGWSS